MIASFVQPWSWLAVAIAAVFLLRMMAHGLRLRRQVEFAQQLLELLHLAVQREQALEPLMQRAASEARPLEQRWLSRIASKLGEGSSLRDALHAGAKRCFPAHTLAAIAAAEGTAQLAAVLGDLARRQDRARALRYQVLLAASYPALLSLLLVGLGSFWSFATWGREFTGIQRFELGLVASIAAVTCCGFWLLLAFGWGHGPWTRLLAGTARRLPWLGMRLRLLPAARAMRACSALIASGASLPMALRQAAHAAADSRCKANFADAAELAERGGLPEQVWQRSGLPAFVIARLLRMQSSREQLASGLREVADLCDRRCADSLQRTVSVLQPAVVLGFGVLVALQFSSLFSWLDHCRSIAMEQMPW